MPIYEWKGFDAKGKKASGIIDADSERDARTKCKRKGNFVTDVVQTKDGKKVKAGKKKGKPAKKAKLHKRFEEARGRGAGATRGGGRSCGSGPAARGRASCGRDRPGRWLPAARRSRGSA